MSNYDPNKFIRIFLLPCFIGAAESTAIQVWHINNFLMILLTKEVKSILKSFIKQKFLRYLAAKILPRSQISRTFVILLDCHSLISQCFEIC